MIELYCRHRLKQDTMPDEYQHLAEFACRRLDHCKYGEQKTACKDCPTHCYAPKEREQIRKVMRWVGPRMIFYSPKEAIRHLFNKSFDDAIARSLERTAVVKITLTSPPTGKRKQYDKQGEEMKYGRME
jgi:hypothetical protein